MMMVMTMMTKRQLGVLLYAPVVSLDTDCVHEQASFVLQTRGKLACPLYIYNSLYSTALEHDECPILHHCTLCRMTQCSQSARTGSLLMMYLILGDGIRIPVNHL